MIKTYIEPEDFQRLILDFITSGECDKVIEQSWQKNDPAFRNGFISGLSWASMMTCKVKHFTLQDVLGMLEIKVLPETSDPKRRKNGQRYNVF